MKRKNMYTWDLVRVLMKEHGMKGKRGHESLNLDSYGNPTFWFYFNRYVKDGGQRIDVYFKRIDEAWVLDRIEDEEGNDCDEKGMIIKKKKKSPYEMLYGGSNKNPKPFPIGTKIRQRHGADDDGNIIENGGTEEYKIVGYKDDLMLIKPLNEAGLYSIDTANRKSTAFARSKGYKPEMSRTSQLLYIYADRFVVIDEGGD